jgi:hypothetical protein
MIRASLQPLAETQQFCSIWLLEYFEKYGDKSPNGEETKLHLMKKNDVYYQYTHEFNLKKRPIVSETKFINLWNVLYPQYCMRQYCDIPGKCETCYEIDRLRRITDESVVQEKLREAHHLHRGGMFMLERNELVIVMIFNYYNYFYCYY